MRSLTLAMALGMALMMPAGPADAAPSGARANAAKQTAKRMKISKPMSTNAVHRALPGGKRNPKAERAMKGRLKHTQDAMAISQSQLNAAKTELASADKAYDAAEAANVKASLALLKNPPNKLRPGFIKSAEQKEVARTRAARDKARTRLRSAQTVEKTVRANHIQNTAVSNALRKSQWKKVDTNQALQLPMPPAPPLGQSGGGQP